MLSYDRGGGTRRSPTPKCRPISSAPSPATTPSTAPSTAQGLPRNPDGVLTLLENYLRLRVLDDKKIALSIAYAETIAPAGDASSMGSEDRNCLVILKRWAQNPTFLRADVTICLIAESLSALNRAGAESGRGGDRDPAARRAGAAGVHPIADGGDAAAARAPT